MISKKCKLCFSVFNTYPSRVAVGKGKYCSRKCKIIADKGRKPWNTGRKCPSISRSKIGSKNPMWKGGIYNKKESDKLYQQTEKYKIKKRIRSKEYSKRDDVKQKRRERQKRRLSENIHFKIRRNISNGIWLKLVRYRGFKKDRKTMDCLPYSINELKIHIENLFTKGMSWDNYGEWHIDHKVPDSSFEYSSTSDAGFQDSWALSNLQPMWKIENLRKGKYIR